ncbi:MULTISPECIES: pyridoxal phosphate-dependent aminotransferase [unclassified Clostridium]|uniref:pyridoxal phosphate-dependent aminotransferase n=1 Tax=Clostridium TaxID=1485 RepID=UPI001C8CDBF2|nr:MULTISPECIES: pyridoxal phosphate-dependent aminotransferase [unclassified Clostridium]MBX9135949.1 pyridoxal phosphate-dependent aminotransferase [Clostridium sp. K12(2020)]MBX9142679.1 pyridoxal phosphate-dependent aminotransferase [Clostridium sp. K13]MDU2289483.1 pyridoxal phosphate-dependent aminotransferase [Clostridium celatum]
MISSKMKEMVLNSSTIRAMFEEGKRLSKIYGEENVFDFSIGNPNVEPPNEIKEVINNIINEEKPNLIHGYMNNSGYEDVREAIANDLIKKYSLKLKSKNIVMTCGAAGGLNIIFKSILDPGDEVIVFAPFFGEYINYVKNFDGVVTVISADTENFQLNLEELKNKISNKTKAVIINSPNNPSGVIYNEKTIKELSQILNEKELEFNKDIYLISDEPYREIIYDNTTVPCILNYYKNSFIGYSYSKSLSLPGERIGYIVINPKINTFDDIASALNIANRILGFVNAPSLFQRVIKESLNLEVDVNIYKKNRDLLYNHLTSIGFECLKPDGAFYLFPKSPIDDDVKFCEDAKKFNILAVPGKTFGCPGYFRLSYCIAYDKIEKSLEAFDELIKLYIE